MSDEQITIPNIYDQKYDSFTAEDKSFLHQLFFDPSTREEIKTKLKHIIFKVIPPTPEEFLDPYKGFLPDSYIADLYPHVKKDFISAMNTENPYSIICTYGSTRVGKTVLSRLFILYTIVFINYLRDPHYYYSISQMSKLCLYLVSFKEDKTKQILLDPLLQLLDASDKFKRERFELNVKKKGVSQEGIIHFSEASKFGAITFPKLHIVCGKDAGSLVGADIVAGAISELTFFKQYVPGMSDEEVMQVFNKLHSRILNTVGRGSFPSWTYIDSSANMAESPLEKMILQELRYDPKVFFKWYVLWELRPQLFPLYDADRTKTFKVCVGAGDVPAKIIDDLSELATLPKHLIIDVPIDARKEFEKSLIDQIKDTAGFPTSDESKLIQDSKLIMKIFNNPSLINIEGSLIAGSESLPEQLLWNQIHPLFYSKYDNEHYIIKRAQAEKRYIAFDNAFSMRGDVLGVACLHKEKLKTNNQTIYVTDFCFSIRGVKKEINLEAMPCLIMDMMLIGQTFIGKVGTDSFQSKPLIQYLERNKVDAITQSIDRTIDAYQFFLTQLMNENFKAGKNIFLKNNLDSLYRTKRASGSDKIDHSNGSTNNEYYGDFLNADTGKNAKDVSDAVCSALWLAYSDSDYISNTYYEDENKRFSDNKEDIDLNIKNAYNKLHKFY